MAKFDQSRDELSPEVQLLARLRLQRVVFGAFAIVLVCLFALGLSAYRKMQGETKAAQDKAAEESLNDAEARKKQDRLERELQDTDNRLRMTRRALALEKCRLAMHEIHDGQIARARALLEQAETLGPPAWAPLVARLTHEQAVRFSGSENENAPVVCGAVSGDFSRIAVVRNTTGGLLVETYGAADGNLQRTDKLPVDAVLFTNARPRLLLSRDGSAWYLPLGGRAWYGEVDGVVSVGDFGPARDAASSLAANADLSVIYEAAGTLGLFRRSHMSDGRWLTENVQLDLDNPEVLAVCLEGERPVILTPRGIYRVGSRGPAELLMPLETRPTRGVLHYGVGVIYAALLSGRTLNLTSISAGDASHVVSASHEMPDEEVQDLYFLGDDTPVWIGRSGRVISMSFSGKNSLVLGGYTPTFVGRHPQGWVFGNRKGELSVRTEEDFRLLGCPVHMVPPQFAPEPRAHGFVVRWPGGETYALQAGQVRAMGHVVNVVLAPRGPAWVEGETLHLPDGRVSEEEGTLLGAFADGSVLLFSQPQKLKHVTAGSVREFLLPGEGRAPDPAVMAAQADVAALRVGGSIFVSDFAGDPATVGDRAELEPSLMALDASGANLAIAYGSTIVVHRLRDEIELTVRAGTVPKQIALLFGGSVLATLEAGELVLYEVETGHELLRTGGDVSAICASGENGLRLVAGARMFELVLPAR